MISMCINIYPRINTPPSSPSIASSSSSSSRTTVQSLDLSSKHQLPSLPPSSNFPAIPKANPPHPPPSTLLPPSTRYQSILKHSNKHVLLRPTNLCVRRPQMGTIPSTLQQGVPNGRNMWHEVDIRISPHCRQMSDVQEVRGDLAQDRPGQGASGPMGSRRHQPRVDR